jgi:excisionase family DNA binding protein
MTLKEAADYLRCHPVTLRRRIRKGKIPFYRPLHEILFKKAELDRILRENRYGEIDPGKYMAGVRLR